MIIVPYVSSPKNACALACYTMTAKHFFPEVSFEEIAKIADWRPGKVVWAFKFWLWLMDRGIKISDYDLIAMQAWAEQGIEGLRASVSDKEFEFYQKNSASLDGLTEDIQTVMRHPNFTYHQEKPNFKHLKNAVAKGKVCEVVLDSHTLDGIEGFALHRVVVVDISNDQVVFHDPRPKPRAYRQETVDHFVSSWLEAVSEPELCVYSR